MQTQTRHDHKYNRESRRRGSKPPEPPSITLQLGEVLFRFLCHVDAVGGVIGSSGGIVKQMERETGARILVEDSVPSCQERVINVIGQSAIDRRILLGADGKGTAEVSQAQEALMRVFDRVMEVEGTGKGVSGCRLLAGLGQVGAVMGKGGKIVDRIRKESGAKIRVLPKDQLPECVAPKEDLIQIMGGMMALKKALIEISRRLQDRTPIRPAYTLSYGSSNEPSAEFTTQHIHKLSPLPGNAGSHSLVDCSLTAAVEKKLSLGQNTSQQEVLFRLLCYTCAAGGIIGKAATIIKAIEKETGASIKFAAAVAGSKERVASIYALEDPEPLYSAAQVAIIRVFARSVEVAINQGQPSAETVTARLLVASDHIRFLIDEGGVVASDISTTFGVLIQLLDGDLVPNCAAENDNVLQINGECENVKSALFEVTSRLRENIFSCTVSNVAQSTPYAYVGDPNLFPFDQTDHLGFLHKFAHPHSPRLQTSQMMGKGNIAQLQVGSGELKTSVGGLEHERTHPSAVEDATVEVVIPVQVFGSVYGENGSNLARLKEISCATIIVQDPLPGQDEGKVIISGTSDQILMAQSLLKAFIPNQP